MTMASWLPLSMREGAWAVLASLGIVADLGAGTVGVPLQGPVPVGPSPRASTKEVIHGSDLRQMDASSSQRTDRAQVSSIPSPAPAAVTATT
jgi:hypothetical protein